MFESLFDSDITLFLYLNNLGTTSWDGFWLFITNKYNAIPLYILLLVMSYKLLGLKKTLYVLVGVALLILVTDQTSNWFKYTFKRLRPCHEEDLQGKFRLVKATCGGMYSYFSGHAANSMAVALYFGLSLKKKARTVVSFLIFWALLVGYSRIYIGVHYPLDVLSGILAGGTFGVLFYKGVKKIWIWRNDSEF